MAAIGDMNAPFIYFDNRETLPSWFIKILHFIPSTETVFVLTNSSKSWKLRKKQHINFIKLSELDYHRDYSRFIKVYKHLSTHPESFEKACFERYFALNAFMSEYEFNSCWHLDTDVIPTNSLHKFSNIDLIFSKPDKNLKLVSAHTAKFSKIGIESLVNYLVEHFYQENFKELEKQYLEMRRSGFLGGITDMTAIGFWLSTPEPNAWFNSYQNDSLGVRISHNLARIKDELSWNQNGNNKLFIILNLAGNFIVLNLLGNHIKYASVHFQGHHKNLIPIFINSRFLIGNSEMFEILIKVIVKVKLILRII